MYPERLFIPREGNTLKNQHKVLDETRQQGACVVQCFSGPSASVRCRQVVGLLLVVAIASRSSATAQDGIQSGGCVHQYPGIVLYKLTRSLMCCARARSAVLVATIVAGYLLAVSA